jgi:hypothetical protein
MNTRRPRRIDRATAEQLLRRGSAGPPVGPDPLVHLLAAAAAPVQPGELAGEQVTMAAFRAAHLTPVPQLRRVSVIKTALAKLLTLKVAATAVAAVTAAGGVALAASNGVLPNPMAGGDRPATAQASGEPEAKPSDKPGSQGSPSPSMVGLCHAFGAGAGDNPGKALENPAFGALISTAGGKDKVAGYCATLLASAKPSTDEERGADAAPSEHPTGAPDSHPTGKPSVRPSR